MGRHRIAKPTFYVTTGEISRHFCFSGFGPYADYKAELVCKLIELGAIYYESEIILKTCTHLICIQPSKNKKFLGACAAGLWILSLSYIQDSHKARNWLLESDYELSECSCSNDLSFMYLAPKICRLQVQSTGVGMFHGWVSAVISDKKKRKYSYKSILKLGGSKFKNISLPLTCPESLEKEVTHIFVDKHCQSSIRPLLKLKILCLNADYIRNFLLLDPAPDPKDFIVSSYIPNTDAIGVLKLREAPKMPTKKLVPLLEGRITCSLPKILSPGVKKKLAFDSCELSNQTKKPRLSSDVKCPRDRPRKINGQKKTYPYSRKLGATKCCPIEHVSPTSSSPSSSAKVRLIQPSIEEFFKLIKPCTVTLSGSDMINASEFVAQNQKAPSEDSGELRGCADSEEIFTEKENFGPFHSSYPTRGQSQRSGASFVVEDELPVHKRSVMMPPTLVNMFDVWNSEDGEFLKSVQFIKSVISERWYPPASIISTVILSMLLDPGNAAVEKECALFLKDLLFIHPPVSLTMKELYLEALCLSKNGFLRKPWEALSAIIQTSISLKKKSTGLLSFVVDLFEENCVHFQLRRTTNPDMLKQYTDLVCAVFWTKKDLGEVNHCCRELLKLYGETLKDDELFEVQMLLQRLIRLVAECFRLTDAPNFKNATERLSSRCALFADAFVEASLDLKSSSFALRKCISSLKPSWLRRHVSENLLRQLQLGHWTVTSQSHCECLKDIVTAYMKAPDFLNGDRNNKAVRKECLATVGKYIIRPELVNKSNIKGETTLHSACARNRVNRVKELLKVPGIDVNVKDLAGWTPLHEAANHGNTECIKILLEFSASNLDDRHERMKVDVYAANFEGITALHDAVINNHADSARILLQYGGEKLLNAKTLNGDTALDLAESEEMLTLLKNPPPKLRQTVAGKTSPRNTSFASRLSEKDCSSYLLLLINLLDSYFDQNDTKHMASALKKLPTCTGKVGLTNQDERRSIRNLAAEFLKYEPSADYVRALADDLHVFQRMDYFVKCLIERLEPLASSSKSLKNDINLLQFVTSC